MKLTKEQAIKLHKQMWTDMMNSLGDNPTKEERTLYKEKWCKINFPNYNIHVNCFLCEYIHSSSTLTCDDCPIIWPKYWCKYNNYYLTAPISEIIALPERKTFKDHILKFLEIGS